MRQNASSKFPSSKSRCTQRVTMPRRNDTRLSRDRRGIYDVKIGEVD